MCDDLSSYTDKVIEGIKKLSPELNSFGDTLLNTDGICDKERETLGKLWNEFAVKYNTLLARVEALAFIDTVDSIMKRSPIDPTLN